MKAKEQNLIEYSRIRSILELIFVLILQILLLPVWLILIILGKESPKKILGPLSSIWMFLAEAKGTLWLFIANVVISVAAWFIPGMQDAFVHTSTDLFTGKIYTYITYAFIHSGIAHLANNMFALLVFGRIVEKRLGTKKMLTVYFLAMIISVVIFDAAHILLYHAPSAILGASGAIMGLVSAGMLLDPMYIVFPIPAFILAWLQIYTDVTGVLGAVSDNVAHFAHIGGFISIAFITFIFSRDEKHRMRRGLIFNAVTLGLYIGIMLLTGFHF